VRIIALENLGRFEEARRIIPDFIQRDPRAAAATLQGLFEAMRDEIQKARDAGNTDIAKRKAESALLLAEQLHTWATGNQREGPDRKVDPYPFGIQLAEAYLETGDWTKARQWFEASKSDERAQNDSRVIFGNAEALYQLREFESALPLFDRFFRESAPDDPFWWRALLRNLQTRNELGENPSDLVKIIEQQRYLHPRVGGDRMRAEFAELELTLRAQSDKSPVQK
jgi:tetratricopeptide (TPR) repeat protein